MKKKILISVVTAVLLVVGGFVVRQFAYSSEVLLDVRTDEEWAGGHAKGAVHFSLDLLKQGQLPDVPKDSKIEVYCRSGRRAEEAKQILEHSGFTSVANIGGLTDWKAGGRLVCNESETVCN